MKLRAIGIAGFDHLPPIEWRFKKYNVHGVIKKEGEQFYYILEHPSFKTIDTSKEGELFDSLEEATSKAENWLEMWYSIQGKIFALK